MHDGIAVCIALEPVRLATAAVAQVYVHVLVWDGRVLCAALEPQQVVPTVDHAVEKQGRDLAEERVEVDGGLCPRRR